MMRNLRDASEEFAAQHGIGEIALDCAAGYKSQMRTAFEAGALWAAAHHTSHAEQVEDVDMILKGQGFGILTTEIGHVDEHRRYLADMIVNALPLSDDEKTALTATREATTWDKEH